jgi:hypothetical protein
MTIDFGGTWMKLESWPGAEFGRETAMGTAGCLKSRFAIFATVTSCVVLSAGVAHTGPCTAQIAQFDQQIKAAAADPQAVGPETGPSAPQTVGAQLHHQPTPGDVRNAEHTANADVNAALDRARKADADGNAVECNAALTEARRLYGLN